MRNRKGKLPSALKHGAFATVAFLPWEDPQEFEKLHDALIEEWMPIGPTERDAVFSIAKGMWRKRRVQYFVGSQMTRYEIDPQHAAYDETYALRMFSDIIACNPDLEYAFGALPESTANHLRQKFPKQNFQSLSEWAAAVRSEVESVLLPAAVRRWPESTEVEILRGAVMMREFIADELAVEQRIDAMIDRAVKRLMQAKAMKEILRRASVNGGDDQPKKIQSSKSNRSTKVVQ
jgi:hypothetical protein